MTQNCKGLATKMYFLNNFLAYDICYLSDAIVKWKAIANLPSYIALKYSSIREWSIHQWKEMLETVLWSLKNCDLGVWLIHLLYDFSLTIIEKILFLTLDSWLSQSNPKSWQMSITTAFIHLKDLPWLLWKLFLKNYLFQHLKNDSKIE